MIRYLLCFLTMFLVFAFGSGIGNAVAGEGYVHTGLQGDEISLTEWHPHYRERCYFIGEENPNNTKTKIIEELLSFLRQEPELAEYLLDSANKLGTAFCLDERADGTRGYFDYRYNLIAIRESLPLLRKLIIFVHELRHIDNVSRGYCHSLDYDIDEMVRLTYAVEADVQAITALYAWRMKLRGLGGPWQTFVGLPLYADIARAFAREMNASEDESSAAQAAFRQWYRSRWRIENYRNSCYMGYLDLLDETKRLPQYTLLPDNFFDELCIFPDGRNYGCHLTPEIQWHPWP